MKNLLFLLSVICCLTSCSLEREIELALPDYDNKLVVECYLEPGQPYRLLLTESVNYFDPKITPAGFDSAQVIIRYNNVAYTLENKLVMDNVTSKIYNYSSTALVPMDTNAVFTLEVTDRKGRVVTSSTTIPPVVKIDSVEFRFDEDSMAFPLTRFKDDQSINNYYRYQVTRDSYIGDEIADITFDDRLSSSSEISIGSSPKLERNQFTIVTLYHISEVYYTFLESITNAIDANGNPFGQPAMIQSNINGGLGIFTGLSYDRKELITPK